MILLGKGSFVHPWKSSWKDQIDPPSEREENNDRTKHEIPKNYIAK
jgi:hypothetical protein